MKLSTDTTAFVHLSMVLMANTGNFSYFEFLNGGGHYRLSSALQKDMTCYEKTGNPLYDPGPKLDTCCSCELDCLRFGTCCANRFWNPYYDDNMTVFKKRITSKWRKYLKIPKCDVLLAINERKDMTRSYYMISTCAKNASSNDAKLCMGVVQDDLKTSIPVIGDDSYLYRNIHCAKCNFVKEFSMIEIKLYCVDGSKKSIHQSCEILTYDDRVEVCYRDYEPIRNCSRGNKFYDLCQSFLGPVGVYANYFCYLCNKNSAKENKLEMNTMCKSSAPPNPPFAWSSLLKITDTSSDVQMKDGQCQKDNLFDILTEGCFPITCPIGYQLVGTKCVDVSDVYQPISITSANFDSCIVRQSLRLSVFGQNTSSQLLEKLIKFIRETSQRLGQKLAAGRENVSDLILSKKNNEMLIHLINATIDNETLSALLNENSYHLLLLLKEDEKLIISSVKLLEMLHSNLTFDHIFDGNRICAEPVALDIKNVSFDTKCNLRYGDEEIKFRDVSMLIKATINSLTRHIYECRRFYLKSNCPIRILLNNTSLDEDGTLIENLENSTNVFKVHEYLPYSEGQFAVCIVNNENESSPEWLITVEKVEGYISSIGSGMSILCYSAIIITYCLFKKLRNIPGYCIMGLCICLLISDGLFFTTNMVEISNDEIPNDICKGIGILIHYFLLAAQFWGFIISLDFFMNMTETNILNNFHNKSRFYKYSVFVTILPIIIIATALILSHYRVVDIQFEADGICAIHGVYGRLFFMLTPNIVSLLLSLVLITISIIHLTNENTKNQRVLSGSHHEQVDMCKVALKLIIVCGLPEMIGFIQINQTGEVVLIVNTVFSFMYSFAKAFRGVMLFIVYVCRSLVFSLYRKRVQEQINITSNSREVTVSNQS